MRTILLTILCAPLGGCLLLSSWRLVESDDDDDDDVIVPDTRGSGFDTSDPVFEPVSFGYRVQLGVTADLEVREFYDPVVGSAPPGMFLDLVNARGDVCTLGYVLPPGVWGQGTPLQLWVGANGLVVGVRIRGDLPNYEPTWSCEHGDLRTSVYGDDPHAFFLTGDTGRRDLLFGVDDRLGPFATEQLEGAGDALEPPLETWTGGLIRTPFTITTPEGTTDTMELYGVALTVEGDMEIVPDAFLPARQIRVGTPFVFFGWGTLQLSF